MKKWCSGCEETKPIKQFNKKKGSQDGYAYQCKICTRARNKAWKESDKGRKTIRQYKQTEKSKSADRRYAQSYEGKQSQKRYAQSERGKQVGRKKRNIRRTRKAQGGGSYTPTEWYNLCKFYDFRCLRCEKQFPFEKLSPDHIVPVSKSGSSHICNIQPLCGKCNRIKHNKEVDYRKVLPDWISRDGPVWQQDTLF